MPNLALESPFNWSSLWSSVSFVMGMNLAKKKAFDKTKRLK
jgi:hypothetical protein